MFLTMSLASDDGDHLATETDAALTRASIRVPLPLRFLSEIAIDWRSPLSKTFLLLMGSRGGWQLVQPHNVRRPAIPGLVPARHGPRPSSFHSPDPRTCREVE